MSHSKSILVVDDDLDTREVLKQILEEEGHRVLTAGDGLEALNLLKEAAAQHPDLIVLDLWMPIMDGWDFRAEQLEDPALAHIPVIVITGVGRPRPISASATLIKPVHVRDLLEAVERHAG